MIFHENIEKNTIKNKSYRKVSYTGKKLQFVYMNIKPMDIIHKEVHKTHDQFIRVEKGKGIAIINNKKYKLQDGIGVIIPAGAIHEIKNTSKKDELKLYTIYAPPEHPKKLEQKTNPELKKKKTTKKLIK
jgi:mannose-6-phosphate isomerase-like protein (cupin superfamily)